MRIRAVFLIFIFIFLSGCARAEKPEGKLNVIASFSCMQSFTQAIAGDFADVSPLIPNGAEIHDWEPTARDIAKLESCDLFIYSGAGLEHFMERLKETVKNDKLVYVEASNGIKLLDGGGDSHVWLDPNNAAIQMENIKNALCEADSANAEEYTSRFLRMQADLLVLDAAYDGVVSSSSGRTFVTAHSAYAYLCAAYGLNQVAIEGNAAESEPTAARLAEIIDFIRGEKISVIFTEPNSTLKAVGTIAQETGVRVDTLSPFEREDGDYVVVMYDNLQKLKTALGFVEKPTPAPSEVH